MRRVAIAGVIALKPDYLVLDEPSAGLDPRGRDEIFAQILQLYQTSGMAVVLISHNMEDVARMAKRLLVMQHGRIEFDVAPADLFHDDTVNLHDFGLNLPYITALIKTLNKHGLAIDERLMDGDAVTEAIWTARSMRKQPC